MVVCPFALHRTVPQPAVDFDPVGLELFHPQSVRTLDHGRSPELYFAPMILFTAAMIAVTSLSVSLSLAKAKLATTLCWLYKTTVTSASLSILYSFGPAWPSTAITTCF